MEYRPADDRPQCAEGQIDRNAKSLALTLDHHSGGTAAEQTDDEPGDELRERERHG
jgi:hypothetical protein